MELEMQKILDSIEEGGDKSSAKLTGQKNDETLEPFQKGKGKDKLK